MKRPHPNVEDSFEKARRAFFGTASTTGKQSGLSTEFFKPQNDAATPEYPQQAERLKRAPNSSRILATERTAMASQGEEA
jgi:hypothetical protein